MTYKTQKIQKTAYKSGYKLFGLIYKKLPSKLKKKDFDSKQPSLSRKTYIKCRDYSSVHNPVQKL